MAGRSFRAPAPALAVALLASLPSLASGSRIALARAVQSDSVVSTTPPRSEDKDTARAQPEKLAPFEFWMGKRQDHLTTMNTLAHPTIQGTKKTLTKCKKALLQWIEEGGVSPYHPAVRKGWECLGTCRKDCAHLLEHPDFAKLYKLGVAEGGPLEVWHDGQWGSRCASGRRQICKVKIYDAKQFNQIMR
uniref:Uncharacterized protein n=1 Tax=Alexandrium andersonii TaxID=327968 RepID=A0A7S2BDV0_9DINO|mmetsp:Transcript_24894/g.56584  ORF Transcript_24894/g.56584 Transcript_24894/m.56584 type:complete len:190 (+) Transcript_24894:75-644(+)